MVFVSAIIPPQGISVFENIDPSIKDSVAGSLQGGIYRQDPESARPWLCNDLEEDDTEWVIAHIVDDAAGLLQEPVDLAGMGDIPRTYVHLTRDMTVPPELQATCVAAIGPADEVDLEAGHMAMVGQPQRLADLLNRLVSKAQDRRLGRLPASRRGLSLPFRSRRPTMGMEIDPPCRRGPMTSRATRSSDRLTTSVGDRGYQAADYFAA